MHIKGNGVASSELICLIRLYAKLVGLVWVVHFEAKPAFPGTSGFIKADIPPRCINVDERALDHRRERPDLGKWIVNGSVVVVADVQIGQDQKGAIACHYFRVERDLPYIIG